MNKNKLTHLDDEGNPSMVDINKKEMTERVAIAFGKITMQTKTLKKILDIKIKKGDVLNIAKIAGIMAAKRTDQLIPLCHTIPLSYVNVDLKPEMGSFDKNNIRQYIKSLSPAFELIIDRNADYANINALTMIADNAWCSGIVLGKELPNWENLDLDIIKSQLLWNDEPPQNAMIKDANPLKSLSWVANLLLSHGRIIPKGSVIITGSVIKTRAPQRGDHIIYKVGNLSEVEIKII